MKKACSYVIAAACAIGAWGGNPTAEHSLDGMPEYGTRVKDTSHRYTRLPDSLQARVRPALWDLGQNSAGLSIRFASDASNIKAKWKSVNKFDMNHMTATGIRGLDLYVMEDDSTWTTVGSARPSMSSHYNTSTIITDMEPQMREYMLFLSLYDGVDSISLVIDTLATLTAPQIDLPVRHKPVVMYGTSILQGGCATRPGMAHTNILQRMLNREVINLGFSGNGKLDLEICDVMADVDAGAYVIDVLPNCTADMLREKLRPFYTRLRAARPYTPILWVESPTFPNLRFNMKSKAEIEEKNEVLRAFFDGLDDPNVYYFGTEDVMPSDSEYTVDNVHFTDAAFQHYAESLYPVIKKLIKE